jgi:hypothetical protein
MWDVDYPTVEITYDNDSETRDNHYGVRTVIVPDKVRYEGVLYHVIGVGKATFKPTNYVSLSSLILPEGLLYLDDNAIGGRTLPLSTLIIPSTVTTIGRNAFASSNLKKIVLPSSVSYLGQKAFGSCYSLESVILSGNLSAIYPETFYGCTKLETINIPEGITRIGISAFQGCTSLESVGLPSSLEVLESGAFQECSRLSSIRLPDNLQEIGGQAFYRCTHLANINIPRGLKKIGPYAFSQMPIQSFTSPAAVKEIPYNCFFYADLKSVTLTNVEKVGLSAFEFNELLHTLRIEGSGALEIENRAFSGCKHLSDVYCLTDAVPKAAPLAFADYEYSIVGEGGHLWPASLISETGIAEQATLHVHAALLRQFKNTYPWSEFKSIVAIEDETAIGPIAIDDESSSTRRVYDLVGRLRRAAQPGLNVIVGSDGRGRKVMVK